MDRQIDPRILRRERHKRWLVAIGILAVVTIAAFFTLRVFTQGVKRSELTIAPVLVGSIDFSIAAAGVVKPAVEYAVVSPINSKILNAYRRKGDSVKLGDTLLALDLGATQLAYDQLHDQHLMRELELEQLRAQSVSTLGDMQMQLEVLKMRIEQQATELRNKRKLDSIGGGTPGEVQAASIALEVSRLEYKQLQLRCQNARRIANAQEKIKELEVNVAGKNLKEMGRTLQEARIITPLGGVITFINDQIGAQVGAGQQVALISDLSRFRVEGELSEAYANRILPGQSVEVRSTGNELIYGQIVSLAPTARNGVIEFSVSLPDTLSASFRSGMRVDLRILSAQRDGMLCIPRGSFYSAAGVYELWVARGGTLEKREVKLGASSYDYIEVISGLQEGDQVVVSNMSDFAKKSKLKIKE